MGVWWALTTHLNTNNIQQYNSMTDCSAQNKREINPSKSVHRKLLTDGRLISGCIVGLFRYREGRQVGMYAHLGVWLVCCADNHNNMYN